MMSAEVEAPDLRKLESEIVRSRRRLDEYVDELDRRRHSLLSARKPAGLAILGLLVAGGALAAVAIRRRRARGARVRRKTNALRDAASRIFMHPERVASEGKSPWSRVLVAVAPIVVKKLADAVVRRRRAKPST